MTVFTLVVDCRCGIDWHFGTWDFPSDFTCNCGRVLIECYHIKAIGRGED